MEEKPTIVSKTNAFKICLSFFVITCIVFVLARYLINDEFRNTVDNALLQREISEETSNTIEINSDANPTVYAHDGYIDVLNKNVLTVYNQDAQIISKIDVNITAPIMSANEKNLVIAELGGGKIYLISDSNMKWERDVEGEIYRVSVNKNGYVSVLLKSSLSKSIAVVYDFSGNELFKIYLSKSYAICSEISDSNEYLAIGQIDYSGTVIKSVVNLISIDLATNNSKDYIVNAYESESNRILNNIKFNMKNEIVCMFDEYIQKVTKGSDERIYDIKDNNKFVDINLENNIAIVEKETSGLFSYEYQMNIKNTAGKSDNLYILDKDIPKKLKASKKLICMYIANEVRVVNSNGWLLKRYITGSEIQEIVVGDSIIGVVYNNKIEVIKL